MGAGKADVVFSSARVALYVDGCFWHGCPEHYAEPRTNVQYWRLKIARNRDRADRNDAALRSAGWEPIHLWEHEEIEAAVARVAKVVRSRRASLSAKKDGFP
jgi:DNA mismatch endonuclease (patch repair protein)